MFKRTFRYNRPETEVLVDILNYTNRSNFTLEQIAFEVPTIIDQALTRIVVKGTPAMNWTGTVNLDYYRHDLALTFSKNPLVIDADPVDDLNLLTAILDQHHVLFDQLMVEIVRPDPDVPVIPGVYNYTLRAKPESLIWIGETPLLVRRTELLIDRSIATKLNIREYFAETLSNKVPIELIYDVKYDASTHASVLNKFVKDSVLGEVTPFATVAKTLTGDEWVGQPLEADFNLMGTTVLYNGRNTGDYFTGEEQFSHVVVLQLGDLCQNLMGNWLIHYNDPTVFTYDPCCIDRDTTFDL